MLMCGGLASTAFGGSPCADKAKATAAKPARRCNICDLLFPNKNKPCGKTVKQAPAESTCSHQANATTLDLPPNAELDGCYTKVIIPAEYKTVTERHLVQEASDRIEIVPAEYKWVEERITVKEASTQLEVVPAEYKWQEKTIEVKPAHTGWVIQSVADCVLPPQNSLAGGIFCYRTTPPVYKTIRTQCLVRPASVREITIPGEYQMVRRQVVASPAMARKVCIPAEYENIEKTMMVCAERVKWEHIVCEDKLSSNTVNKVKSALLASGFKPGPLNGEFAQEDRVAMIAFQQDRGLGVGQLSYDTLKRLGVSAQ
jgi:hypothetical protein